MNINDLPQGSYKVLPSSPTTSTLATPQQGQLNIHNLPQGSFKPLTGGFTPMKPAGVFTRTNPADSVSPEQPGFKQNNEANMQKTLGYIQNALDWFGNLPGIKQGSEAVGATVGALGSMVGRGIAVPLTAAQGQNPFTGAGAQRVAQVAGATSTFGSQVGTAGGKAAPLGVLGKIPSAILATAQGIQSLRKMQDAVKTGDWEKAIEGGLDMGMAAYMAKGAMNKNNGLFLNKGIENAITDKVKPVTDAVTDMLPKDAVSKNLEGLGEIEKSNAPIRRYIASQQSRGIDVKDILANTDLLQGAVDNNGKIDTSSAQTNLREFIRPQESVISDALKAEGTVLPFDQVKSELSSSIEGLTGSSLTEAQARLKSELAGLETKIDENGNISLSEIQKAKISKMSHNNYLNPEANTADKIIASKYRKLIEENTQSVNVKQLNGELASHYAVLDFLDKLNGKIVKGGRLGKYFAKTVGAVAGSHFGPLGSIAGSEIAGAFQGQMVKSNFSGSTGKELQQSPEMTAALEQNQSRNIDQAMIGKNNSQSNISANPSTEVDSFQADLQNQLDAGATKSDFQAMLKAEKNMPTSKTQEPFANVSQPENIDRSAVITQFIKINFPAKIKVIPKKGK